MPARRLSQLWAELSLPDPTAEVVAAAREALFSEPPFAVYIEVLALFPRYLNTPGEELVRELLVERGAQIGPDVLEQIGAVFVALWRKRPRTKFWYGDLRQSFVPYDVQVRLASVRAVEDQLLDDFRTLARAEREHTTDLGCRRLERAGELLLHAPSQRCRETLAPIVALDYLGPQQTRPLSLRYEPVYWGMLRILRKLGDPI